MDHRAILARDLRIAFYPEDRINPILGILAQEMAATGNEVAFWRHPADRIEADVIHLHWAEAAAMGRYAGRSLPLAWAVMRRFERALRCHRRGGGRVVWTAHNARPHEADDSARGRMVAAALARIYIQADAVICMSEASVGEVEQIYPALAGRTHVIRHPSYAGHFATLPARPAYFWRQRLGLGPSTRWMALAGLVRRYKRVVETIRAFDEAAPADTRLVIAGPCYDAPYAAEVAAAAARSDRAIFCPGRLDDPDFRALLAESATVLVPQDKAQNSGTLIAALSAGTPAFAAATPTNLEIAALVGPGWLTLADTLDAAAITRTLAAASSVSGTPDLSVFDPALVARRHLEVYRGV